MLFIECVFFIDKNVGLKIENLVEYIFSNR